MNMQDLKASDKLLTQALEAYQEKAYDKAHGLISTVLKQQDKRADAWTLLGMVQRQNGKLDEARKAHLRAIEVQANYASAYNNLANLEREAGHVDEAIRIYQQATLHAPDDASIWGNLGSALALKGAHNAAEKALRTALGINPNFADAHWDLALALLNQGQFKEAFSQYEWRFERKQPERPKYTAPVWNGEPLKGRLLLYAEQGYGDCLQYLRFLPHTLNHVESVVLYVQAPLEKLLKSFDLKNVSVVTTLPDEKDAAQAFQAHASLLSLPALLNKSEQLLGQSGVYLAVDDKKSAQWKERTNAHTALKVGLVWAGNPNVKNDKIRSPRFAAIAPLLQVPDTKFFSLQKGDGLKDLEGRALPENLVILDAELNDFLDTACAISAMDLIITSDTSVAHLAGALGKRAWVLNPMIPDWRWVGPLNTSYWYLNAKVYKAHMRSDWSAVMQCVEEDLQHAVKHRQQLDAVVGKALALYQKKQFGLAWDQVQLALDIESNRVDIWNLAAVLAKNLNAPLWAEMAYRNALRLNPRFSDARCNLGHLLKAQGRHEDALVMYRLACENTPEKSGLWVDLSDCLRQAEQAQEAKEAGEKAVALDAGSAEAWNVLGAAQTELGETAAARDCFLKAVGIKPDMVEAVYNLGVNYHKQGEALLAIEQFQHALQIDPKHCSAQYNMGSCLQELGRSVEAEEAFRRALLIKPEHFPSLFSLAAMCHFSGKFKEAYELEKVCLQREPGMLAMKVDMHYLALKTGYWKDIPQLAELTRELFDKEPLEEPPPPFSLMVLPTPMTEGEQLKIAKAWSRVKAKNVKPLAELKPDPAAGKHRRMRVGYASSDFHNHATMHLMRGMFPLHNREKFEVFGYSWGPDDKSSYRKDAEQGIEHFKDLQGKTSVEIARIIAADNIDILVDLKGHTRDSRIEVFYHKPAPVQAQYIGYPGSLGAECFDYIITDRVVTPPEQQAFYTEKFAYLPHCYQVNDQEQSIDTDVPDRAKAQLPEDAFVFACFCSHYKVDPFVFAVWMRVLKAVPNSVLWLLAGPESVQNNFIDNAMAAGIEKHRIVFGAVMAKPKHLARLGLADLFLDTRWYNAHTTASDALWAGVPVLTCPGNTFAQRVGASLVHAIEMPELVAKDWDSYEAMAIAIAKDKRYASQLKMKLANKRLTAPLFQTAKFVSDLEQLYSDMWEEVLQR
jgi:predicted O-linked N-acetylglucosamine transferase (SPINDLY family)